jgi:hypothetical protein
MTFDRWVAEIDLPRTARAGNFTEFLVLKRQNMRLSTRDPMVRSLTPQHKEHRDAGRDALLDGLVHPLELNHAALVGVCASLALSDVLPERHIR